MPKVVGCPVRLRTVWQGEPLDLHVELPTHATLTSRVRGRSVEIEIDLTALVQAAGLAAVRSGGRAELLGGLVTASVVG